MTRRLSRYIGLCGGLLSTALLAAPAAAQSAPQTIDSYAAHEGGSSSALARGRYAVVIDLDENRLFFRKGEQTLWSAPIGTGTGLRLQAEDKAWDFSTPRGVFQVKYKEENPVWIAPDWFFVENGLPIPPEGDKRRMFPGGLGAAAIYIDKHLAIHGTDKPELLGQRVSHGCIRLADKDALRLFHNVQVGTEVIIVGGEDIPTKTVTPEEMQRKAAATFSPGKRKAPPKDPLLEEWKQMSTDDLLVVLGDELWLDESESRWYEVARLLLKRGLDEEDDVALAGLLTGVADVRDVRLEREYKTFLADAFARGAQRTLEVLSLMNRPERERAAAAIVEASMELYHGSFEEPAAPWPTRRIPRTAVAPGARRGWYALEEAEKGFRSTPIRRAARE